MIAGEGFETGMQVATPVYLQDVMPTTLEPGNIEKPEYVEFQSLVSLCKGEHDRYYDSIYGAYELGLQRMIIRDDMKLIAYPDVPVLRLFHLENDPHEMNDPAGLPEFEQTLSRMFEQLIELQNSMNDPLKLPSYGQFKDSMQQRTR